MAKKRRLVKHTAWWSSSRPGIALPTKVPQGNSPSINGAWPCTCGGNNANCYKCDGLGTTTEKMHDPRAQASYQGIVPQPKPAQKNPQANTDSAQASPYRPPKLTAPYCKICHCQLIHGDLDSHMLHAHPAVFARQPRPVVAPVSSKPTVTHGATRGTVVRPEAQSPEPRSFADDGRDGSKHIGHFAREHGRYGSMPMHDDYSDEGDA